jgi:hypothetical protein
MLQGGYKMWISLWIFHIYFMLLKVQVELTKTKSTKNIIDL